MCDPIAECAVQFQQAAEKSSLGDLITKAMENSGGGVGVPKMSKEQFNEFCNLFDIMRKCFEEQHAATLCESDPYYKIFSALLRMCQPPNRQSKTKNNFNNNNKNFF